MAIRLLAATTVLLALARTMVPAGAQPAPTAAEAEAFVAKAEAELTEITERSNRVSWIALTFITDDTNWLKARTDAEFTTLQVAQATQAARYDRLNLAPDLRR